MIAARRTSWSFALDHALALRDAAGAAAARARGAARRLSVGERSHARVRARTAWPTTRRRSRGRASRTSRTSSRSRGRARGLSRRSRSARAASSPTSIPGSSCRTWSRRSRRASTFASRLVDGNGLYRCGRSSARIRTARVVSPALQKHAPPHLLDAAGGEPARARPRVGEGRRLPRGMRDGLRRRRCSARRRCARGAPDRPRGRAGRRMRGGSVAARDDARRLRRATARALRDERNHPDADAASGLSPYLHFGHISAHEIAARVGRASWDPARSPARRSPGREGWWGLPAARGLPRRARHVARARLHLLLHRADYGVRRAARVGAGDAREARARSAARALHARRARAPRETDDPVWNAAQRQLARRRPHPQLPAHAVGQEDPRVVGVAAGGARDA